MNWFKRKPKETLRFVIATVGVERHMARLLQQINRRQRQCDVAIVDDLETLQRDYFSDYCPEIIFYDIKDQAEDASFRDRVYAIQAWRGVTLMNLGRNSTPDDILHNLPSGPSAHGVVTPLD